MHDLRAGEFDVLIGIILLREGLDLPEVSLVGIFDADKEGFLRSVRSLIQTCGRASRNANGRVIMYADKSLHQFRSRLTSPHHVAKNRKPTTKNTALFQKPFSEKLHHLLHRLN